MLWLKEADTMFIEFNSSEKIQNLSVKVISKEAYKKLDDELSFIYFYVFQKQTQMALFHFQFHI